MWIHLVSLGLIDGAGGGVTPPTPTDETGGLTTYLVGEPKKKPKKANGLGGPRWQRYELEDLSRVVVTRPFEEVEAKVKAEADAAIAKAARQAETEIQKAAAAQLAQAQAQALAVQQLEASIQAQMAEIQAMEDAEVMRIIAKLL